MIIEKFGKEWTPINLVDIDLSIGLTVTSRCKNTIAVIGNKLFYLVYGATKLYIMPYSNALKQQTNFITIDKSIQNWPSIGTHIFVGNNNRLFLLGMPYYAYTDDLGETWTYKDNNNNGLQIRTALLLNNGNILAGSKTTTSDSKKHLWISQDNGETFSTITTNKGSWSPDLLFKSHTGRIFAPTTLDSASGTLVYSDDNGSTWVEVQNRPITDIIEYNNILYLAYKKELYYSIDDGLTWTILYTHTGNDIKCLAACNNKLFLSAVTNIYYTDIDNINFKAATIRNSDILPSNRAVTYLAVCNDYIACSLNKGKYVLVSQFNSKGYPSKPLTGAQAKELVQQCKAYVQVLKLEQQNS